VLQERPCPCLCRLRRSARSCLLARRSESSLHSPDPHRVCGLAAHPTVPEASHSTRAERISRLQKPRRRGSPPAPHLRSRILWSLDPLIGAPGKNVSYGNETHRYFELAAQPSVIAASCSRSHIVSALGVIRVG